MTNPAVYLRDPAYLNAVRSLKRTDEKGYLYEMDCSYDYYKLPDVFLGMLDAGCSTFFSKNQKQEYLLGRNYDYSHYYLNDRKTPRTGMNVIVHGNNPAAKYRSLGVADAYWCDYKNGTFAEGRGDDGTTDLSALVILPFVCMDGINEAGLGVSIMALCCKVNWEETDYDTYSEKVKEELSVKLIDTLGELPEPMDYKAAEGTVAVDHVNHRAWIAHMTSAGTNMPGKPKVLHPVLMRMMLDNCADVEEAVKYASQFNVASVFPGSDYHILVCDSKGNSVLLEWWDNEMKVIPRNRATNYHISVDDGFHGKCGRDACLEAGLFRSEKNGMREDFAKLLLQMVHQEPDNGMDYGITQYSCIYNVNKGTLEISSFCDFSVFYTISL